jgi:hypothetical protein
MEKERKEKGRTENWPGIYTPGRGREASEAGSKRSKLFTWWREASEMVEQSYHWELGLGLMSAFAGDGRPPEIIESYVSYLLLLLLPASCASRACVEIRSLGSPGEIPRSK